MKTLCASRARVASSLREFANSDTNHLGVPLPKGRVRFYRRDQDGQMEFTGENEIDHTPKDETVRVYTGGGAPLPLDELGDHTGIGHAPAGGS